MGYEYVVEPVRAAVFAHDRVEVLLHVGWGAAEIKTKVGHVPEVPSGVGKRFRVRARVVFCWATNWRFSRFFDWLFT